MLVTRTCEGYGFEHRHFFYEAPTPPASQDRPVSRRLRGHSDAVQSANEFYRTASVATLGGDHQESQALVRVEVFGVGAHADMSADNALTAFDGRNAPSPWSLPPKRRGSRPGCRSCQERCRWRSSMRRSRRSCKGPCRRPRTEIPPALGVRPCPVASRSLCIADERRGRAQRPNRGRRARLLPVGGGVGLCGGGGGDDVASRSAIRPRYEGVSGSVERSGRGSFHGNL